MGAFVQRYCALNRRKYLKLMSLAACCCPHSAPSPRFSDACSAAVLAAFTATVSHVTMTVTVQDTHTCNAQSAVTVSCSRPVTAICSRAKTHWTGAPDIHTTLLTDVTYKLPNVTCLFLRSFTGKERRFMRPSVCDVVSTTEHFVTF